MDMRRCCRAMKRGISVGAAILFGSASFAFAYHACGATPSADRQSPPANAALTLEAPYLSENQTAMNRMMMAMAVKPTGDVDRDFVAMMVPHHQGAIDMAIAVLHYGHNEKIRRLAQEIIVTQQQEIAAMRLAVASPLPPSVPSPTQQQSTVK